MSNKVWFASDHHLGHANILKFTDDNGELLRGADFGSIEEHDKTIIDLHNALVSPSDRVYFGGDVVMNRRCLPLIALMNGRKKLIKGNHDIFHLKDYIPYFEDVVAMRVYADLGILVTHVPVHPCQLEHRFKVNVHGHLHHNVVGDPRYINMCLEHTDYKPILLTDIQQRMEQS